ncbi:MAG TPA: GNAT family N-acetyltransferase [Stellaceae bacterium]|nr:GNAT family N-acetyltransferase [Stellaceae bacterium]
MHLVENPDFLHLPAAQQVLFARAAERSFFALPLWYHVLSRHGTDKATTPRLYFDDRDAPALALICQQHDDARRLASLSTYYSTEHGPLYAAGEPRLAVALAGIAAALADERPAWHALQLAGLNPADPSYDPLIAAFGTAGWAVFPYFDSGTWYEDTGGLDFARYLAERPAALRNTWRRRAAKIETENRARLTFHEDAGAIDAAVADYDAVYRASWKGSEPFPDFMPALIRAAAETGALRLGILRIDDVPAAAQLWLHWRGRTTIYKLAHDRRFDNLSVGTVLTMRMMERTLERDRPIEIDFGRGDDGYKKLWLTKRRERWGLLIANPRSLPGLALSWRERAASHWRRWRRGAERR